MKLSIIVPFHKGSHFLKDCFESIRDQGLSEFETVLILDHAEEDVTELLEEYQDINLKVIELNEDLAKNQEQNKINARLSGFSGVAAARNAGLEAANGEYVYFLDSDDYILNETLRQLLKEAQEQAADFTYGKKKSTWFGRMAYLASIEESEEDEESEEQESVDSENNQDEMLDEDEHADEEQNFQDQLEQELNDQQEEENIPVKLTRRQKKIRKIYRRLVAKRGEESEFLKQKAEAYYTLFITRKGLLNVSVLGILFRRSFLNEKKLRFHENYVFFSDVPFVVEALVQSSASSYVREAVYVKRKHNDPVHFPSLSQIKAECRFNEYMGAYREVRGYSEEEPVLLGNLENKLIAYYAGTYAPRLRRSEKEAWRKERFQMMRNAMLEVNPKKIERLKKYKKKLVKALLANNVRRATDVVTRHLAIKKLKKIKKNNKLFAYYLYHKIFTKLPIKNNWVLCETFFGKSYSDSPKYIYEYLYKHYPGKYKFIWCINGKTKIPGHPVKVKRNSIRYCYYLARCKYDVFNVRQPKYMRKREGNVFLETWHGTPLKRLVFDQDEVMAASPLYKAEFYRDSKKWDYLVAANQFSSKVFRSAFQYEKEMLEFGYPRNDILHHPEKERIAAEIKKKLQIPEGKKTILYAPTWRDDEYYGHGQYKFTLKLDLRRMMQELGEDYVVLLRTHYFIADALDVTGLEGFAFNVSKYDDISELYLISDLLITDYSSVFFDYANLKRPILFYTYDLDKYRDMLRGFYMDIETEVPGPLLFTNEEVIEAIRNINDISMEYKEKYDGFYERFCSLEDGHASENIVKRVFHLS